MNKLTKEVNHASSPEVSGFPRTNWSCETVHISIPTTVTEEHLSSCSRRAFERQQGNTPVILLDALECIIIISSCCFISDHEFTHLQTKSIFFHFVMLFHVERKQPRLGRLLGYRLNIRLLQRAAKWHELHRLQPQAQQGGGLVCTTSLP